MSPEAPGNLVALDISPDPSGFVCRVERYEPTSSSSRFLRVSWNAISQPEGYERVAGGAAYVDVPDGFTHRVYDARPDVIGPRLRWRDSVFGDGLMLLARLPYGYTLAESEPRPVAAKLHEGRMAVYWLLGERGTVLWRLEASDAGEIARRCSQLNEQSVTSEGGGAHSLPVDLVNHSASRHYPPGIVPDAELARFHDLCAWLGEQSADDAQISFTGVLLTFMVADDPISRWFQGYIATRRIAVGEMLDSKGLQSLAELQALAGRYQPSGLRMNKQPWTKSAREVLTASEALSRRVAGEGSAIAIRHVMGAYCHFHFPNHQAQLQRWGFNLNDWLSEYRKLLRDTALAPAERAGWFALFKEMGLVEVERPSPPPRADAAPAATPAGWDIFIAHASSDRVRAEQLYELLEARGRRVFLDARSLKPGDFWDTEIPRALATSRVIAVLVTQGFDDALYLRDEIVEAISRARLTGSPRLVPVYLDGVDGIKRPYGLSVVQHIDARALGGLGAVADTLVKVGD